MLLPELDSSRSAGKANEKVTNSCGSCGSNIYSFCSLHKLRSKGATVQSAARSIGPYSM